MSVNPSPPAATTVDAEVIKLIVGHLMNPDWVEINDDGKTVTCDIAKGVSFIGREHFEVSGTCGVRGCKSDGRLILKLSDNPMRKLLDEQEEAGNLSIEVLYWLKDGEDTIVLSLLDVFYVSKK
ncbi:hypothetical protein EK21DRAFT_108681 [Setomelanomma holmii]|uniref:Uncharacterized protein n=1 Tax=Setomelanomma holmii TaxID=210430 RepID=A0A9P4HG14_9PLEO|nr:hypothetical protein EK21DRAFT_108681 [Setomelanomma holmii]